MASKSMYVPMDCPLGLSDAEVNTKFPAIYQGYAAPTTSSKYKFRPSWKFIAGMRERGFVLTSAMESWVRDPEMRSYAKHFMWFTHRDSLKDVEKPNAKIHRVGVQNSHRADSALWVFSGLWVKVCNNGLTIGDIESSLRVMHTGSATLETVFEKVWEVVDNSTFALAAADLMEQVLLDERDIEWMGQQVLCEHFAVPLKQTEMVGRSFLVYDKDNNLVKQYEMSEFTYARHPEQKRPTLFNIMNRYEEALRLGGQTRIRPDGYDRKVRGITSIRHTLKNQGAIWNAAEKLFRVKTGKNLPEAAGVTNRL